MSNMSEIPTGNSTSTRTLIPNPGDQNVKHVRDTNWQQHIDQNTNPQSRRSECQTFPRYQQVAAHRPKL